MSDLRKQLEARIERASEKVGKFRDEDEIGAQLLNSFCNAFVRERRQEFKEGARFLLDDLLVAVEALENLSDRHDSSCSLSYSEECDCVFQGIAERALEKIKRSV